METIPNSHVDGVEELKYGHRDDVGSTDIVCLARSRKNVGERSWSCGHRQILLGKEV